MRSTRSRVLLSIGSTLQAALAAVSFICLPAAARTAFAAPGRVACLARGGPRAGSSLGPCLTPDVVDYFVGEGEGGAIVVTNFGLLLPGERVASWQVVCDDNFGLPPPEQIRFHPDGHIFAASAQGLFMSPDACAWSSAADIGERVISDVAFDRQQPVVLVLGDTPRRLWRSTDGGKSFTVVKTFSDAQLFERVVVAPSDGKRVYLFGRRGGASTAFARSSDGGQTFEFGDLGSIARPPSGNPLTFVAAAPDDPSVIYFSVINAVDGDEIWRTSDAGHTVAPMLHLGGALAYSGFTFGKDPHSLYVAGTDPLPSGDKVPAQLFVSKDGGNTWATPIPSSQQGPRYRCLSWSAGKLYACGAGELAGDRFLVGASSDEGLSWEATATLRQVSGAKSCVQARCQKTEQWLCENYCYCAPGAQPSSGICIEPGVSAARDAGSPSLDATPSAVDASLANPACAGNICGKGQGWCNVAGSSTSTRTPWLLIAALMLIGLARSRN